MPPRLGAALHERWMPMQLTEQQRILLINAVVLIFIIVLLITMPRTLFEREPPEPPQTPQRVLPLATSGEESLLVLLSEYNFDHEPRFTARVDFDMRFCTAIRFIDPVVCTLPIGELAFSFRNETASGVLGYAIMEDATAARALMDRYASLTSAADGTYLSVTDSMASITDHALITGPDEFLVFYHPVGSRFEHAWIARFDHLFIYGYENTPERTITRKFTHAFDPNARALVLNRYNLTQQSFGERT